MLFHGWPLTFFIYLFCDDDLRSLNMTIKYLVLLREVAAGQTKHKDTANN